MEKLHMLHTNSIQNNRWNFYLSVNINDNNLHAKLHTVKVIYCVSLKPCIIIRHYISWPWVSLHRSTIIFQVKNKKVNILVDRISVTGICPCYRQFFIWKPHNKYIPEGILMHRKTLHWQGLKFIVLLPDFYR